ncbi:hypothetical protein LshimejAT787_0411500 [Lyophyllum shimeji]|uniref:Uncharacterized protein n=1 Tax=Lyophyllum shimeji TaxID=47721 RepID=A0A9P3PMD9_LYOSH|nr:hypothetical protein LshimejAT787_0411500 [Lyophyllum shimeji]
MLDTRSPKTIWTRKPGTKFHIHVLSAATKLPAPIWAADRGPPTDIRRGRLDLVTTSRPRLRLNSERTNT